MFERRNHVRRAICGGLVVGALAGACLAVIETIWLLVVAGPALVLAGGVPGFGLPLLGLAMGAGALLGLFEGLVVAAVVPVAEILARKRVAQPRWEALLYTAVLTPVVAWLCAEAFSGRKARQLPAHFTWVVGSGVVLIGLVYLGFRVLQTLRGRFGATRTMAWLAAGAVAASIALLAADRTILVRRYGFFHASLELLAFSALELAIVGGSLGLHAGERRWARLAAPRGAAALALLGITGAAFGLARFRAPEAGALRIVAHDHGTISGRLLDLARVCGFPPLTGAVSVRPGGEPRPAAARAGGAEVAGPRLPDADLILITVDALRADHLGAWGYGRATSPHLDALARESVVFEHAYAPVPHTSFSIASLMTGKFAWSLAALGLFDREHETLPDAMRRYGYHTAGFFPPAVFYVDGERFKRLEERRYGFDHVRYEPFHEQLDAQKRTDQVIAFLDSKQGGRVLLWVHYFGPHEPYVAHPEAGPPFGDHAVDAYDGEIRWVDAEVGRLLDHLAKTRPGAVVAITADHGEEFGEHGGAYHGTTLYEEQVHVPLLFHVPGVAPRRVRAPVSTLDVFPTLLALADVPPSPRVRGTDLTPWMGGGPGSAPAEEKTLPPVFAEIDALKMVALGSEKLICDPTRGFCRLFDLASDPTETKDLGSARPGRVEALRQLLAGWMESHGERERVERVEEGPAAARRRAVERAELGDHRALPQVVEVLADPRAEPGLRTAAARVLARLPHEDARAALAAARRDGDPRLAAWATVALATLGDREALEAARTVSADGEDGPELSARAALARAVSGGEPDAVLALAKVVDRTDDVELRRELLRALGRTRDPRATPTLLAAYDAVRTRKYAVFALGDLGDRAAVPFLVAKLPDEPYVSVRAAAAHALGQLGDPTAVPALQHLFAEDRETQVVASAAWALARLGAARPVRPPATVRPPPGATELWLVPAEGASAPIAVAGTPIDTSVPRDAYAVPAAAAKITGPVKHLLWR